MNHDPDDRINDHWTVEQCEQLFEGEEHQSAFGQEDHFLCDFCSVGISYASEPRLAFYVADDVLNRDHPAWRRHGHHHALVPLAVYCEDCATKLLLFPCEGYGEVRLFFDLDADRTVHDCEVTDISPPDDGIPWEPKELSEKITGIPWEQHMFMQMVQDDPHLWGPENMITFFLSSVEGVDPRQLIQHDGSFDPKALGRARKSWKQFRKKMQRGGYERRKFRDHVRGDDRD